MHNLDIMLVFKIVLPYYVDMYVARASWPSSNGKSYQSIAQIPFKHRILRGYTYRDQFRTRKGTSKYRYDYPARSSTSNRRGALAVGAASAELSSMYRHCGSDSATETHAA